MTTIKLRTPIKHGDKTYAEIPIHPPTLGAIASYVAAAPEGDLPAAIALMAANSGIPEDALRKVAFSDFAKAMDALAPFVQTMMAEPSGSTGERSEQT